MLRSIEILEDEPILPKITQHIIRKKDLVEIGTREYDKNGKLVYSKMTVVTFKSLDDKIFEIPEDKIIKTFKTQKSFLDFENDIRLKILKKLQNK